MRIQVLRIILFCQFVGLSASVMALNSQVSESVLEDMTLFQFSQVVAEEFDYAIIFSPRVRKNNKVGLVVSESLESENLYNVFLSVLDLQGYAAVKTDNVIRIVREYKSRSLPSLL